MSASDANVESNPIRCVVADDHALVRAGLVALLAREPDVRVVGEAGDGPSAVRVAAESRPNVLLIDLALPGLPGLEVIRQVRALAPELAVVVVSVHKGEEFVFEALRAGASGYVVKEDAAGELPAAIRTAADGRVYLSPAVARAVREGGAAAGEEAPRPHATPAALSPREREVLVLIAEGLSTKEIAARLGISVKTADAHRQGLMRRLGIRDVAGLVKFAVRHGLTDL